MISVYCKLSISKDRIMNKWVGKTAVVTGASAGIGAAIVVDLMNAGINVIGLARRVEQIEEIRYDIGYTVGKLYTHKCDVSDQESIKSAFKWIEEEFGIIHILVNNAGVVKNVSILEAGDEAGKKLDETISTNFTGLIHCTRAGFQLIKKSNDYGFIININSIAGQSVPFINGMKFNVYPATKHAVRAASEVLRQELISMNNNKIRISVS